MTVHAPTHQPGVMEALDYRAPFLIEKLLKEQIVETAEEGELLFTEVVRYLVLDRLYPEKKWQMFSRRVDEVWHQFVLFTYEYVAFCDRYFGKLLHHFPSNAPGLPEKTRDTSTREADFRTSMEFRDVYERTYGLPLSDLWYDQKSVTLDRRLLLDFTNGPVTLELDGEMVNVVRAGATVFSVSKLAEHALMFILRARTFYVRELPGDLSDEEKLGLVGMLMATEMLVLGS